MVQSCIYKSRDGSGPQKHDQEKLSSQSSSKLTTCHSLAGIGGDEGVESGWRPETVFQSPFTTCALQDKPLERSNSGQFAITPPDSCTEEDLHHWPLAKHGPSRHHCPERTKSKLLSSIADEMSRSHHQAPRHARKNSTDSQDSIRRAARKRRAWQLTKALSAPGEDIFQALQSSPWSTPSPCDSGNWVQPAYKPEQASGTQTHAGGIGGYRPELQAFGPRTAARKRYTGRYRTSRFIGVGSSNRKTQWQARILVQGKVTHLGYYATEEEAARIYDRVALSLNPTAQTNFPASHYTKGQVGFSGLGREDLQRALGVKPMDKSSRFRGVSRKKGKWEAKVMVNRKWAFRALFDSEDEAAHAYDAAVWRLKPREATSFVNFKDGVSVRNSPAKSLKSLEEEPEQDSKLDMPAIKLEEQSEPLGTTAVTLSELHIPGGQQAEYPSDPADSNPLPLRSQSVQLPIYRAESAMTDSCVLPPINALNSAPSLPEIGLARQGSILAPPGGVSLSPQQSLADQTGLPSLPNLPALSVSLVPHLDLPDPNSIGVPPPENLPFPELVTGGGVGLVSKGVRPSQSLSSTPSRSFGQTSDLFPGQPTTLTSSGPTSSGFPPLHQHDSITSENPSIYLGGSHTTGNTAAPCSAYTELRPTELRDNVVLNNPFLQASSLPTPVSSVDLDGLPDISPIERQPSIMEPLEVSPLLHRAATEGMLSEANISGDLPYDASVPELGVAVGLPSPLPHNPSLSSINTAQYVPSPAQLPPAACSNINLGPLFLGGSLPPVTGRGMPQVEPGFGYDATHSLANSPHALANSRTASSSFLHANAAANSGMLLGATESGLPTASSNSLPILNANELAALGHGLATLPGHRLHHSVSMDASFLGRPEMLEAQLMQPVMPPVASNGPLSIQQADLLRNLDVDVELNDPLPINPVQIGGENMNVYSAHIMGDMG